MVEKKPGEGEVRLPGLPGENPGARAGDEVGQRGVQLRGAPRSSSSSPPTAGWTSGPGEEPGCRLPYPHRTAADRHPGRGQDVRGLGICGRPFCCSSFLREFQPVSIKMAKTQNLSLNPTKISGTCGRLMCCLKYEQNAYEDLMKGAPKADSFVETPRRGGDHQQRQHPPGAGAGPAGQRAGQQRPTTTARSG